MPTRVVTVNRFASFDEAAKADRDWWEALSAEQRVALTWRLSEELWRMIGKFPDEPGLCRSVARVYRR
jgi:hypothetical protein